MISPLAGLLATSHTFVAPAVDWWALAPQIILLSTALVVLLASSLRLSFLPVAFSTAATSAAAIAAFIVTLALTSDVQTNGSHTTLAGTFGIDGFSLFFTALICLGVLATALIAHDYVKRHRLAAAELAALLLASATGAIVMASANDLIVLFLGLETLSIALYVLIATHTSRADSRESAVKYFVLGAVASAFFLYGVALVYGATGTTSLSGIGDFLATNSLQDEQLLLIGVGLITVGLAFKVAAAPFHMWAADVYQGAPSPITGYMSSIAKAAGFAALIRVVYVAFTQNLVSLTPILTGLAFATMAIGAVLAIRQDDVKRMLAYSSVSHAGYILVGVQAASTEGASAALFYIFTYAFLALGSFAVLTLIRTAADSTYDATDDATAGPHHSLSVFRGLAQRHPVLALSFTFLLLAQAGVPLTSGFISKFQVIAAAVGSDGYIIAVFAMLVAVVAAFAYLRLVLTMYAPPDGDSGTDSTATPAVIVAAPTSAQLAIVGCVAITVAAGIVPQFLIDFANDAVALLSFA